MTYLVPPLCGALNQSLWGKDTLQIWCRVSEFKALPTSHTSSKITITLNKNIKPKLLFFLTALSL